MIDRFVALCFEKRLLIGMMGVFFCVYGVYAWTQLPVEVYPLFSDVYVQVTTDAPGLAAEEVEQQITVPLERALNGVPGLARMRSNSTFGLSIINMRFRDGYEDYWVRQRVTERIGDVTCRRALRPR
jgi:cobalt-zinc-cadmium resistance protein CzcA